MTRARGLTKQNRLARKLTKQSRLASWLIQGTVGGGPVSHPVVTSHPVIALRTAEGSVDIVENSLTVTPEPAQGVLEQQVQPVLRGTEKSVDSQVELILLGKLIDDVPLRMGTRVWRLPDQ